MRSAAVTPNSKFGTLNSATQRCYASLKRFEMHDGPSNQRVLDTVDHLRRTSPRVCQPEPSAKTYFVVISGHFNPSSELCTVPHSWVTGVYTGKILCQTRRRFTSE